MLPMSWPMTLMDAQEMPDRLRTHAADLNSKLRIYFCVVKPVFLLCTAGCFCSI